jgi:transposase-like protein
MKAKRKRRVFDGAFRAKVALAACKGDQTLSELAARFEIHPNQVSTWRKELVERAPELFADGRTTKNETDIDADQLYAEIGRLRMELEWLKKKATQFGG